MELMLWPTEGKCSFKAMHCIATLVLHSQFIFTTEVARLQAKYYWLVIIFIGLSKTIEPSKKKQH